METITIPKNKTADVLDFDKTLVKSMKMLKAGDKNFKISFLVICGIHFGVRGNDLLSLRHSIFDNYYFQLQEQKTKKVRKITINPTVIEAYQIYKKHIGWFDPTDFLFKSQKRTRFSLRQVNNLLNEVYGEKGKVISSHTLRKMMGRRIWENDGCSDRSLIILSQIFNHSSVAITRRYLGIMDDEIEDI